MYSNQPPAPQTNHPPASPDLPSVDDLNRELFGPRPTTGSLLRRLLRILLPLLIFALILIIAIPPWRARVFSPLADLLNNRLPPTGEEISAAPGGVVLVDVNATETATPAPATPVATFTPTPTPHPAAVLDFAIDTAPERIRWQIAYADSRRGPGLGCAYLGFWLTGSAAEDFAALADLDAELLIYQGDGIIERHGPAALASLRSLGEPRYYELPAGEPECLEHRLAEAGDYAGLEFRLNLQVDQTVLRQYRGILGGELAFATPTPTATPAPPTPTPFPQARIVQAMNVRAGPGVTYALLGAAPAQAIYPVTGANPQFTWWQIDYLGQRGWVYGELVAASGVEDVAIVTDIAPAPPPPPTATPVPPTPTITPIPTPYFPFLLVNNGVCTPNSSMTYFKGKVLYASGDPFNGACIHVSYEGPRNTKCSGCGESAGEWGFAPFGNLPGKSGLTVRIYVVPCPEEPLTGAGQNPETGFGPLNPVSPVWTYTIGESVQCTGIVFQDNQIYPEAESSP